MAFLYIMNTRMWPPPIAVAHSPYHISKSIYSLYIRPRWYIYLRSYISASTVYKKEGYIYYNYILITQSYQVSRPRRESHASRWFLKLSRLKRFPIFDTIISNLTPGHFFTLEAMWFLAFE